MTFIRSGRKLVYPGETLYDTDVLLGEFYKMMDVSWLAQSVLGNGLSSPILFSGLACTPVSGLTVNVAPGAMYESAVADSTTFGGLGGGLPADTADTIFKQYLSLASTATNNFTLTNNLTVGQYVYYMIEAQAVTSDVNPQPRQYFNISNPASPITNTEPETRQDYINFRLVEGTPSSSNPPPVPTPDAGYTGLYLILLTYGQVTIVTGNISPYPGTVFITESLTQKISETTGDARYAKIPTLQTNTYTYVSDTGTANAYVANPTPAYTAFNTGMALEVLIANNNTGSSTINVSSLGNKNIILSSGQLLVGGELVSGMIAKFYYDGTNFQLLNPSNAPVICRAYTTTNQDVGSGVTAQISFNVVSFDNFSYFNTSSHQFVPLIAGYYRIYLQVQVAAVDAGNTFTVEIRKNGLVLSQDIGTSAISPSGYVTANVQDLIYLNGSTDYIDFAFFNNSTQPMMTITQATEFTYVTFERILP